MSATQTYPTSRYESATPIDLRAKEQRARLSPAALAGFFKAMERWRVRDEDARQLLGDISHGTYYAWKKRGRDPVLDGDVLVRISYLIGIFKALHLFYSQKLADEWIGLPNTNRIFGGATPLEYMIRGGSPAMQTVRRLLEARRSGV